MENHFNSLAETGLEKVNLNLKEVLKLKFLELSEKLTQAEESALNLVRQKYKDTFDELNVWY